MHMFVSFVTAVGPRVMLSHIGVVCFNCQLKTSDVNNWILRETSLGPGGEVQPHSEFVK